MACLVILGCSHVSPRHDSTRYRDVQVLEIAATALDSSASMQDGAEEYCKTWHLTAQQAELFFALSKEVDARTYHHTYDTSPCKIDGRVKSGGRVWQFTINGAAKARWVDGETTRYLGCELEACASLVMDPFVDPADL